MSPAGRISWAEVPVTSGHFVSPRKARTRSEDSFEIKSHKKYHYHIHIHSEASNCSTSTSRCPWLSHDSRPQRPRMATAAIAWGLDLFRGDLFRLHAWAAESQQVPRRRSAPGSLESYGRSQFYSPTWPGNQWLVFNCWVFFGVEMWLMDCLLPSQGAAVLGPFCVAIVWDGWLKHQP